LRRPQPHYLAFDLGAGSGRAMLGVVSDAGLELTEVHRFHYAPETSAGHLRWPFAKILEGIETGLVAAQRAAQGPIESLGACSWGVDYGLVDDTGRLLEDPIAYRDHRTDGAIERVLSSCRGADAHRAQFLQFNTLFQLHAHAREGLPAGARRLLMIPDLCHHALCGSTSGEYTNASTSQLLDVRTRRWADDLFSRLGLPRELMPDVVPPGTPLGELRPALREKLDRCAAGDRAHSTTPPAPSRPLRSSPDGPTSPRAPGRWSASSGPHPC
jgi:rhamnulokinase